MILHTIKTEVVAALRALSVKNPAAVFEHPAELAHGDYSTNAALVHAKELKLKPREVAEKIVAILEKRIPKEIEKVEVAGAGFINFYLSKEFFAEELKKVDSDFGKNKSLVGKKVMVEYSDLNPFMEFHIGHLMSNAIGESIARLLEFQGAETRRACYQGDVGLHVAKALFGYLQGEKQWGLAYANGNAAYERETDAKKEIEEINKKIYSRADVKTNKIYDFGKASSLKSFDLIYKTLGTKFDFFFFESETGEFGKKIVAEFLKKGVFEKSEGAIIFKGENHGLHTRVFINKEGLPTYEAKEIALPKIKHDKYPYDVSVILTGNEVNDYFRVLLCALGIISPELAKKTKHLSHGMLRLPSGKMSSRTGTVITAESLIGQVKEMVRAKLREREMAESEKEKVAEVVAIGAIKYSILRQAIGGDIIFDLEHSISFEGDSGPYLQYSYVRANSVLAKAGASQDNILKSPRVAASLHESRSTRHFQDVSRSAPTILERLLSRFPEVVGRAGAEYAPHYITTYLTELAGTFNSWYANEQIVDQADPTSPYKVALTSAFSIVMRNGLWLLGIKVPEKM